MHREGFLIAFPRDKGHQPWKRIHPGEGKEIGGRKREGKTGRDEEVAKGRDERATG